VALKGYFGSPGSGKTHEVVQNVIVPAIRQGRRVVTNIAGLDHEAICDWLVEQGCEREKLGTIYKIELNEGIAGKFAVIVGDGENAYLDEEKSIVRGGDIVVLDEVWRVWEDGVKLHPDDRRFLRMHRHLIHKETHVTCDVALISQTYTDVHRQVRNLIEERYEMAKLLALGMRTRYRVSIYGKGTRVPHQVLQKKYDKQIFQFYKSHSMGTHAGKEVEVDGRGNVFKGSFFAVFVPLVLVAGLMGVWGLKHFFSGDAYKKKQEETKSGEVKPVASAVLVGGKPGAKADIAKEAQSSIEDVAEARVVGYFSNGTESILFIDVGGRGLLQRVSNDKTIIIGQYVEIEIDGKKIGTYTGKEKKRDSAIP
jgi:zona occludens toxin